MKSLSLNKPHLIIMVGIPGSGKTFFAEHFSSTFKAPFINLNYLRSNLFTNPTFSDQEDQITKNVSDYMLDQMLKTNQTIIYEGLSDRRAERIEIVRKAREAGYESLLIWVQTEPVTAKKRATAKSNDNQMSNEVFNEKIKRFSPPHSSEKAIVISGKHTYTSQLKIALIRLASKKPIPRPQPIPQVITPTRAPINRNILIR